MDPDVNLKEQIEIARQLLTGYPDLGSSSEDKALRLAELVLALDNWIIGRGYLPERWQRVQPR